MNDPTRPVTSAARMSVYHQLNPLTRITESQLFALINASSCVLDHDRYGGHETARLVLETVASPAVALAAVRTLEGDEIG